MNNKRYHSALIDLAEGMLDPVRRQELEDTMRRIPAVRRESEEIRKTMEVLKHYEVAPPPDHYFGNFIPQLRRRLYNETDVPNGWIPSWFAPIAAPVVTVFIIGIMTVLYSVLHPDAGAMAIHDIIRQTEQSDLDNTGPIPVNPYYADMEYTLVDAETAVRQSLLAGGNTGTQNLYENDINDERMMIQLNEQDLDGIVAYLQERTFQ